MNVPIIEPSSPAKPINNEKLSQTIRQRAPYSLAITVPAMALGWALAMILSTLVAYYRAHLIDHAGVFLAVLGMCIPYLAFIMAGQWLMFKVAPGMAYGLANPFNIFVPVGIAVVAGLGYVGYLRHEVNEGRKYETAYHALLENTRVTQEAFVDREKTLQEIKGQAEARKKVIYVTKSNCGDSAPEQPIVDSLRLHPASAKNP